MAKRIGDYVHLHLQNYYNHGTKRNLTKTSDFNANLFETHHRQLRMLIEKQQILNLDAIAEQYNKQNEAAWKMFQQIDKQKLEDTEILHHLLHEINSLWTDEFIDVIISGLSISKFIFS